MTQKREIAKAPAIEFIIQPSSGWLNIPWRDLLHYRDLLFLLVRRDFIAQYKQTILGPLWFLIQPLLTTIVFTVIFSKVAKVSTEGVPALLFNLCGVMIWTYFSSCLTGISATFTTNAYLFNKVYFPRLIMPFAVVLSKLMALGVQCGLFLGFWIYFKVNATTSASVHGTLLILALPLVVIHIACLALGIGLWISALTAKYKDFSHLVPFMTQLWMFLTPVFYPVSIIPEQWHWLAALNPMTGIILVCRKGLLGIGGDLSYYVVISIFTTGLALLSGLIAFNRAERTFVDTI